MLQPWAKVTLATIFALLKTAEKQLKEVASRTGHEKVERACEHLEHCLAEIEDAVKEIR